MPRYRSFHNADPPALAALWQTRLGEPGFGIPVTTGILEQLVFSRPYFDPQGLILAWDDAGDDNAQLARLQHASPQLVGAVHGGFGADESGTVLARELGVISHLLVHPDEPNRADIASELIHRAEDYLRAAGAKVLYAGEVRPVNPFYLGLYGGSELPGILETDAVSLQAFKNRGYEEIDRTIAYDIELAKFRPVMDRRHVMVRRKMQLQQALDPPTANWWEACTLGSFDLIRFNVTTRSGDPVAHALFRGMDIGSTKATFTTAGLVELEVSKSHRRQGVATFLLTEAFHNLARQGVRRVSVRTMVHNKAAQAFYKKLGCTPADQGIVLRKKAGGASG